MIARGAQRPTASAAAMSASRLWQSLSFGFINPILREAAVSTDLSESDAVHILPATDSAPVLCERFQRAYSLEVNPYMAYMKRTNFSYVSCGRTARTAALKFESPPARTTTARFHIMICRDHPKALPAEVHRGRPGLPGVLPSSGPCGLYMAGLSSGNRRCAWWRWPSR